MFNTIFYEIDFEIVLYIVRAKENTNKLSKILRVIKNVPDVLLDL